eukprot:GHVU01024868.1.p3 GENE.GHVU01024868.1~~GHVU01024868.1.p3  ORF type:complete len:105 (-),score=8.17 GHVU01024868.1:1327-1641(-)
MNGFAAARNPWQSASHLCRTNEEGKGRERTHRYGSTVQRMHTGKPPFHAGMVPSHTGMPRGADAQAITEHAALTGISKRKSGCCTKGVRHISNSAGMQRLSAAS